MSPMPKRQTLGRRRGKLMLNPFLVLWMQVRKPERLGGVCVGAQCLIVVYILRGHSDAGGFRHKRAVRRRKVFHRLADQHY